MFGLGCVLEDFSVCFELALAVDAVLGPGKMLVFAYGCGFVVIEGLVFDFRHVADIFVDGAWDLDDLSLEARYRLNLFLWLGDDLLLV